MHLIVGTSSLNVRTFFAKCRPKRRRYGTSFPETMFSGFDNLEAHSADRGASVPARSGQLRVPAAITARHSHHHHASPRVSPRELEKGRISGGRGNQYRRRGGWCDLRVAAGHLKCARCPGSLSWSQKGVTLLAVGDAAGGGGLRRTGWSAVQATELKRKSGPTPRASSV
ncbi:hypothetical protein GQ53DRAFT_96852 [Thozetella sp. PMI_491]|nr:hypothetical protein GQ53DRAFT_96852 [Thozetella sp. PMI_491]